MQAVSRANEKDKESQAIRRFHRLALTDPSQQTLPSWTLLNELAHNQDHACGSQQEPGVNRTTEGNTGHKPRNRQPIQEEEAESEQSCTSCSKWRQSLKEPIDRCEQDQTGATQGAPGERTQQRDQTGGHEPQTSQRFAPLNEIAKEGGIRHHQSAQEGREEADQVPAPQGTVKQSSELGREGSEQELSPPASSHS